MLLRSSFHVDNKPTEYQQYCSPQVLRSILEYFIVLDLHLTTYFGSVGSYRNTHFSLELMEIQLQFYEGTLSTLCSQLVPPAHLAEKTMLISGYYLNKQALLLMLEQFIAL